jgi:hypothetical protein
MMQGLPKFVLQCIVCSAFLVEHLDDLDDVMDAVRKITGKVRRGTNSSGWRQM